MVNLSSPTLSLPPPPPAPAPPTPAPCKTALCGALIKHAGNVNLSATGTSDWVHYGLGDAKSVNRKCKAGALIQDLKHDLTDPSFDNSPQTFTWVAGGYTDGTPAAGQVGTASSTPTGIYTAGSPFSFTIQLPEVAVATSVFVYVGACGNQGIFTAQLADSTGASQGSYLPSSEE